LTVRAIQPAVVLIATTDTPESSVNAVRQHGALDKLLGCPRKHLEGDYLELRDATGALLYASGAARRAAAGNWFVDPSLGIRIGHGPRGHLGDPLRLRGHSGTLAQPRVAPPVAPRLLPCSEAAARARPLPTRSRTSSSPRLTATALGAAR
jgi:hypothetical protein